MLDPAFCEKVVTDESASTGREAENKAAEDKGVFGAVISTAAGSTQSGHKGVFGTVISTAACSNNVAKEKAAEEAKVAKGKTADEANKDAKGITADEANKGAEGKAAEEANKVAKRKGG